MGMMASVNCYTMRVNLSVALVVMVNHTWIADVIESKKVVGDNENISLRDCKDHHKGKHEVSIIIIIIIHHHRK